MVECWEAGCFGIPVIVQSSMARLGWSCKRVERARWKTMSKASGGESKNTLYCSFCGKSQHEVRKLIAGPTVFICDECVELCMEIIREENKTSFMKSKEGVPTPQEIFKARRQPRAVHH